MSKVTPALKMSQRPDLGRVSLADFLWLLSLGKQFKTKGAPSFGDLPWVSVHGQGGLWSDICAPEWYGEVYAASGDRILRGWERPYSATELPTTGGTSHKSHRSMSWGRETVVFSVHPPSLAPASLLTRKRG